MLDANPTPFKRARNVFYEPFLTLVLSFMVQGRSMTLGRTSWSKWSVRPDNSNFEEWAGVKGHL